MTTPAPVQPLVVDELDDEVCLFRPDVDEVLVLNATAADIWHLLDGRTSTDDIAELLTTAYGADPATVLADVRAAVADLVARGFVVLQHVPDAATTGS